MAKTNDYTQEEVWEMYNNGKLTEKQSVPSDYQGWMEQATKQYNESVASNNASAESQKANALAEYNNINRNLNEINKANGRANTGYAGDTSIDAYNSYRNAINDIYTNTKSSNNELYDYYMNSMFSLQEKQKSEEEVNNAEAGGIIEDIISNDDLYYSSNSLSKSGRDKVNKYLTQYYGSLDNVPNNLKSYLNTINGYSATTTTATTDTTTDATNTGAGTNVTWKSMGSGKQGSYVKLSLDGTTTEVKMGEQVDDKLNKQLNVLATGYENTPPSEHISDEWFMDGTEYTTKDGNRVVVYDGDVYIYTRWGDDNGKKWQKVEPVTSASYKLSSYKEFINKYLEKATKN